MRTIMWPTKPLSCLVVIAILSGVIPYGPARAELVATESVLAPSRTLESDRARLRALLDRQDVQGRLQAYGISAEEAAARVDALTDREVALIADRLDEVPAGADAGAGLLALAILLGPAGVAIIAVVGIGLLIALAVGIVVAVKKAADAAKQSEPATPTPSPSSPQPPQAVTPTPQYQWKASESRERAIKEIFCRDRHLAFRSDWRDQLPKYRACLEQ